MIADVEIRFEEIYGSRVRDTEGYNRQQNGGNECNNEARCCRANAGHDLSARRVLRGESK